MYKYLNGNYLIDGACLLVSRDVTSSCLMESIDRVWVVTRLPAYPKVFFKGNSKLYAPIIHESCELSKGHSTFKLYLCIKNIHNNVSSLRYYIVCLFIKLQK